MAEAQPSHPAPILARPAFLPAPLAAQPEIRFTSQLPITHRVDLERLLYFNDNQHKVEAPLREALRRYGSPSMVVDGPFLRFSVPQLPSVQTLYAVDEAEGAVRLAAVSIYTRMNTETLSVLFFAVHEDYAGGQMLGAELIEVLRANGARTKGVRWLHLPYPKDLRIPVRRPAPEVT